ncbi:hypothetical protein GCM10012288_03250 [Malaciobacter pacificus]|jgi:hypothetical protein|uniref:DUF58 domain-containing protein n=1 Tax=Malaciobacter pacificus TaxID=1080223 RepID=A0A5C2H908_9BACT|nr:DUF58 domain-containing protein [Malaciobacter pacificus]QEP33706.1 DUF58 domain-containing protein [Malaciobacter pacificus]GGD32660.1 hypothetical protein GCM10012288_03250 [Malaciobacter pacificus]
MNQALKKILIKTKKNLFSEIIGNNSSLKKGEGYDFCELKEYEYGDDVKNIDWLISAKMQKPYVKQYHTQKELNIKIVSFLTGSTYFGTKKFKQEIITELASSLGYISIKQGDPFASFIANETLEICTKKSKKIFNVNFMAEQIYNYNVLGKNINYKTITKELFKSIHHKSIIFLIGDFFDIDTLDLKLLCQKHEVIALIVRDNFEENPAELGNVNFVDPMTNKNFDGVISKGTIKNYIQKIKENDRKLFNHFQDCGIKFTKIYTHEDSTKKLIGVLR